MTSEVLFSIQAPIQSGENEIIGIVGNIPELGMWKIENAMILKSSGATWTGNLSAVSGTEIKYRYFSGVLLPNPQSLHKMILVSSWEVHTTPRCVVVPNSSKLNVDDGEFGTISGRKLVDRGWLTHQNEFRFYISSPKNQPFLQLIPAYLEQASVDLSVVRVKPEISSSNISSSAYVISPCQATQVTNEDFPVQSSDHVTITVQTMNSSDLFVKFIICSGSHRLGVGVLSCSSLASKGITKLPLLDDQFNAIGSLRVSYLHIKPFSANLSMEFCFTKYWKQRPLVHVGHRGSGNSFSSKILANQFENTLSSFIQASENGADFIEFDVHLTKDEIPIVYHDLTTCVVARKGSDVTHLVEVPVKQLTLDEVRSLKIAHRSRMTTSRQLAFDEGDLSPLTRPFPTLAETFEGVPIKTGFNIEVKWPTLSENNAFEDGMEHYFDADKFVNLILKVVFEFAHSRKIIFSSFDVDICIMLRRKQNRYPVLFLTNGDTGHYTPMLDRREATNDMAIGSSIAEGFLGIDSLAKDVHQFPGTIEKAHKAGLIFACYGDDVGDDLALMVEKKVDVAIYDRIYEKRSSS